MSWKKLDRHGKGETLNQKARTPHLPTCQILGVRSSQGRQRKKEELGNEKRALMFYWGIEAAEHQSERKGRSGSANPGDNS